MSKNQSKSKKKHAPRFEFSEEMDREEMEVLRHNLKTIEKGIDLKKLISMAEPEQKKE